MEEKDGKKVSSGKRNLIHIQYCTNCQSHNWNTHHNEAKYQQTYIKLKNLIEDLFKQHAPLVAGNKVPNYLIPIKEQQNKYYNQNTKKYVFFPNVGSFQISFNGQLIFSKKKTNVWPNFQTVLDDISIKIQQKPLPKIQKPKKKMQNIQQEQSQNLLDEEVTVQKNKTLCNQQNVNTGKKIGGKFTLTDHYKTFHQQNFPKVKPDSYHFDSSTTIKQVKNKIDVGDIQSLRKALKTPINFNKDKMNAKNDTEILVDLSSIEEQQGNKNKLNSYQSVNLLKKTSAFLSHHLEPILSINNSEKQLSLKRFQDINFDLKNIEKRFQNIESKINFKENENTSKNQLEINQQKGQKEDLRSLSTSKYLQQLQQAISKSRISQKQLIQGGGSSIIRQFLTNPLQNSQVKASDRYDERYISPSYYQEHEFYKNYKSKKFSQIEAYLKASNEQKNKKLKKIYGQWKVGINDINYIAYLQNSRNSRKEIFRDSTNSSGEKTKNRNKSQQNSSSSQSSQSSLQQQKSKNQQSLKKPHKKQNIQSQQNHKSKSKNIQETRKDVKKYSSFIIKHKSVFSLPKNQSKQNLKLLKLNKQKINNITAEQLQKNNNKSNKFSFIEKRNQSSKVQNSKNSRSLHSRIQNKKIDKIQIQRYKKQQILAPQVKNTLKKVQSKKQMKFQYSKSNQLQRSLEKAHKRYEKFQKQQKQKDQQDFNEVKYQKIQKNHSIIQRQQHQKQDKSENQYQNQKKYQNNKHQIKKDNIISQKNHLKQNNRQNEIKAKGNQLLKSKTYMNRKQQNQDRIQFRSHSQNQSLKGSKKQSVSNEKQTSKIQFAQKIKQNKLKNSHQLINNAYKAPRYFETQKMLNQTTNNQAQIKLNKRQTNQKQIQNPPNSSPKQEQKSKAFKSLQKKGKIVQKEKLLKQNQSISSLNQKTPINSLLNSLNASQQSSQKEIYMQQSQKSVKQVSQYNQSEFSQQGQQIQLQRSNDQKKMKNQSKSFKNHEKKRILLENKKLKEQQQKERLSNPMETVIKNQKSKKIESQNNNNSSQNIHYQNQRRQKQSKKIYNKNLKSKTQAIKQKSPQFKQKNVSIKGVNKSQQKKTEKNKSNGQMKADQSPKAQKELPNKSKVKSNKNFRSVSSIESSKDKQLKKSNSNKVHSFFKIEKQSKINSEIIPNQSQENSNQQQQSDRNFQHRNADKKEQKRSNRKHNSVAIQTMQLHQLNKYTNYLQGQKSKQNKVTTSQRTQKSKSVQSKNSLVNSARISKRSNQQSIDSLKKKQVIQDIYSPTRLKVDKKKRNKGSLYSKKDENQIIQNKSNKKSVSSSDEKSEKQINYTDLKGELKVFEDKGAEFQEKIEQFNMNSQEFLPINSTRQKALILKQIFNMDNQLQNQREEYDLLYKNNKMYQSEKQNFLSEEDYLFQQLKRFKDFYFINNTNEVSIVFQPIQKITNFQVNNENQQIQLLSLFDSQSIKINQLKSHSPFLTQNLQKTLKILADKNELLIARLFQDYKSKTNFIHKVKGKQVTIHKKTYGMWLCMNKIWRLITIDNIIPVRSFLCDKKKKLEPVFLFHQNKQLWPMILQKCLAKAVGSYKRLFQLSVGQLFSMLTGSNHLAYFINENISKNKNLLQQISENDKKNFIMVCDKYSAHLKEENQKMVQQPKLYYLQSKKIVNNGTYKLNEGQKDQILFKIKQLSTLSISSQQPYYMRYDVFCENFKLCEVLHLRQHQNFSSLTLNKGNLSTRSRKFQEGTYFNVVQLTFDDQSFGSITVSNQLKSDFKTYLYKLENSDNQIMKLVGQASKQNKKQLFFDCFFQSQKYYLFIQSSNSNSIVTYMGDNKPEIKVKQKILTKGLRNKSIEYLPISSIERNHSPKNVMGRTSESFFSPSQFQQTFSKRPQSMQDLRQMFIGILLEQKKNN